MFIKENIYKALPEDLKEIIINTKVISSHGTADAQNFTTKDKLYLLSTKEVWGKKATHDTLDKTRQLDYYVEKRVTGSNYSGAVKKYGENATDWWFRSAYSLDNFNFHIVNYNGVPTSSSADISRGVSPAFRIG